MMRLRTPQTWRTTLAEWQEVGDRIYRRRYQSLDLNVGLILSDEGAIVIDSRAHHGQADELLSDIASRTRLPIRTLINTHYHWDHTFGNAVFAGVPIWGHTRSAEALRTPESLGIGGLSAAELAGL